MVYLLFANPLLSPDNHEGGAKSFSVGLAKVIESYAKL